jgi:NitT/TauT family transport system ATP-binding protein
VTTVPRIEIREVSHTFRGRARQVEALRDVSLRLGAGEIFALVGPSGCGKTTLLNLIAGLEACTAGEVVVDGRPVTGPGPDRGVVFQQYALFPWMTARGNVEFGLRLRRVPRAERAEVARRYLDMVGLRGFDHVLPKELSGGMKQRVAIARAYAVRPSVLLMDEPFGALDAQTRAALQEDLLRTWAAERTTILFITHDVEEAVFLAHRVAVMTARPGRIREIVAVDLPHPRSLEIKESAEFVRLKHHIWRGVFEEHRTAEAERLATAPA